MKKKDLDHKNFLSKFLIKIIRKLGFEIIDQANLFLPDQNLSASDNLSKGGDRSITIPLGITNIKKKINSLTIIIRSYTFGDNSSGKVMLDQNKKRIFELPKIEYTIRTIKSVISSSEKSLEYFKNLKIKIIITDDKSNDDCLNKIKKLLENTKIETEIINLDENEFISEINVKDVNGDKISTNMISNMRNILKSIKISEENKSDLFYFLEDDYIHTQDAITEMLFTYEKLSSQLNREIFLCPADYPFLYSNIDDTKIFFGNTRHWRTVKETLITFMTSKKMLQNYINEFKLMGSLRHHPMEQKLHEIYEKEYCLSPMPSLAMHATNINSMYGIPPNFNWKKVWEENN